MKIGISGSVLLGALLLAGCGGPEQQQPPEETQAPTAITDEEAAPGSEREEWFPGKENAPPEAEGTVGTLAACCYVRCSNNPPKWLGPYRNVEYGNCSNYAKYRCAQSGWKYVSAKWDDC